MAESLIGKGDSSVLCPPVLTECDDGTVGLYVADGASGKFLQWVGVEPAEAMIERHVIIPYIGAEGIASGTPSSGVPADVCCYGRGIETGEPVRIEQDSFGLLSRKSDKMQDPPPLDYCKEKPAFNLETGERIDDTLEWAEAKTAITIWHDLLYESYAGDNAGVNHWGLEDLLDGTYTGWPTGFEPNFLDWNGHAIANATPQLGITLNGAALDDEFRMNLYATIHSLLNGLATMFERMPGINGMGFDFGDIAFVGPKELFPCIARACACWTLCSSDAVRLENTESRLFYHDLMKNGVIDFPGLSAPIPWINYNPFDYANNRGVMQNADGTFNFLILWRGNRVDQGVKLQYRDMREGTRPTRDEGLFQVASDNDENCKYLVLNNQWRWRIRTPNLQSIVKNVACGAITPVLPAMDSALANCEPGDCP